MDKMPGSTKTQGDKAHRVCFFLEENAWKRLQYLKIESRQSVPVICTTAIALYVERELLKFPASHT
jgi:hypothetical protein